MTETLLSPPKQPCGTCPYRKDVPAGIWSAEEYAKLPGYDGETWEQSPNLFMCHQRDGCLCGGWLMTHDREHLLALRLNWRKLDPKIADYAPKVDVFASGAEAAAHGLSGIEKPSAEAMQKISGLLRQRAKQGRKTKSNGDSNA